MKKKKVKKNKRLVIIKSILILAALVVAVFSGCWYMLEKGNGIINKNVYVENINLGRKNLSEAEGLLQDKLGQPMASKKIEVTANDKKYVLDCSELQAKYNIDEAVKEALNYGKEGNILDRLKIKLSSERKDFKLKIAYNTDAVDEFVDKIEKENNKTPVDARISINYGNMRITPEINGTKLESDKLKQDIIKDINSKPKEDISRISAVFDTLKAKVTSDELSKINTLISSYSTNFSTSKPNRVNNIELAAKSINGTVLMPGESFSFNGTVGERTKAKGYKEAGVIIDGNLDTGLGGGICQVSSTLYNAVLTTDLKVEERRNHTLPSSYVPKGLDATVDWGNIDFKFKNTLNAPIYIEGYTSNKNLYFKIYSSKDSAKEDYKMVTDLYATVEPQMKYINDPNLPEGETQVIKGGSPGYRVKTYKQTYKNGKLINTELISKSYYKPVNGEIAKGTKKVGK